MRLFVILFLAFTAHSAEQIEFYLGYRPDVKLEQASESQVITEMSFEGDSSILPPEFRQSLPVHTSVKQATTQTIITGKAEADGSFPINMRMDRNRTYLAGENDEFVENPSGASNLEGITLKGRVKADGSMEYIGAEGENIDPNIERVMPFLFKEMEKSNLLAREKVGLNETVILDMPMSLPVSSGGNLDFDMQMHYTLKSVKGDIAKFDVKYVATVNAQVDGVVVAIKGSGDGVMDYDIVNQYPPLFEGTMNIDMDIPMGPGALKNRMTSQTRIVTTPK